MRISAFRVSLLVLSLILSGCESSSPNHRAASRPAPQATAPALVQKPVPQPVEPPKLVPPADPVEALITRVEAEYQAGDANYKAGHLEAAKLNFDRAINLLLESKQDIRANDRLQQEFDKIVERVNGLEMVALKAGDGFTEQKAEPAPIDEAAEAAVTTAVDPVLKAKAAEEVKATVSDLPLVLNDLVANYLSFFSGRGRGTLERALIRSGRYRDMIYRTFKEEGVPQDLIYLAVAESGFHPLALSRAGARGMWQFMASRAVGYGLERNWWVDDRQDPEKATRAAARHLRDLHAQFGDWYLAIAAYNSGPGNIQQAVERTGYADFWELYRRDTLPKETKNYVPIILAVAIMAKNPAQYGLDRLVPDAPLAADHIVVRYPVDLRLVAECVDAPLATLIELNPSLLRMTTPKDSAFDLHLPPGTKDRFEAAIAAIPQDKRVVWRYHRVETGESLAAIARQYHTTPQAIAAVNDLENGSPAPDSKIIIPVSGRPAAATSYSRKPTRYRVRKGDTVLSVADDFGVPADRVRKWNHLRGNALTHVHLLTIYPPAGPSDIRAGPTRRTSRSAASSHKRTKGSAREATPARVVAPAHHKTPVRAKARSRKAKTSHPTTIASKRHPQSND